MSTLPSGRLDTDRLTIRAFEPDDLSTYHRISNEAFGEEDEGERESWLRWSILNQEWFPKMHQPPYGDRAIALKSTGALIGGVGFVPILAPFDQIPELRTAATARGGFTPEFGLFWVIDSPFRRQGFATEAAQAMIDHAFRDLHLHRIIATTEYDNIASQAVMGKLGMTLTRNPLPDPPWLQIVGVQENQSGVAGRSNDAVHDIGTDGIDRQRDGAGLRRA